MLRQLPLAPKVVILVDSAPDARDVATAGVYLHFGRDLELVDEFGCEQFLGSLAVDLDGIVGAMMETHSFEGDGQYEYLINSNLHLI